jgi:hypothetical protein
MLLLLQVLSLPIVDYDKLCVCIHEAAHIVVAQEFNKPVYYGVLNQTQRAWEGVVSIKDPLKNPYQKACIYYAGFFIESQFRTTLFSNPEFGGDREGVGNISLDTISNDLGLLFSSEIIQEHLVYLSLLLYYQTRVSMKAPSHYDEVFANWEF